MTRGKYAAKAATRRADGAARTAEQLRDELDAAQREVERLTGASAAGERDREAAIAREVREALREERARMKASMRENQMAATAEIQAAARKNADRDAAIVEKLETALRGLLAHAAELTKEAFIDADEAIVIADVFDELGVKHAAGKFRSILGVEHIGQVAAADGAQFRVSARFLNRRSAKRMKKDTEEDAATKLGKNRVSFPKPVVGAPDE